MAKKDPFFKDLNNAKGKLLKKHEKEIAKIYSDAFQSAYGELLDEMAKARKVDKDWNKKATLRAKYAYVEQLAQKTIEVSEKYNVKLCDDFKDAHNEMFVMAVSQLDNNWFREAVNTKVDITNENLLNILKSGKLYESKDGVPKELSERIWDGAKCAGNKMQTAIASCIAQGKGPAEMAKVLKEFGTTGHKTWSRKKVAEKLGPGYARSYGGSLDYEALRLARTTMTHLHQLQVIQSNEINPYVNAVKYHSVHSANRTCAMCEERDGQIFSLHEVPLDHPNGMCWLEPIMMINGKQATLEDIARDVTNWINGEEHSGLMDKAYPDLVNEPTLKSILMAKIAEDKKQEEEKVKAVIEEDRQVNTNSEFNLSDVDAFAKQAMARWEESGDFYASYSKEDLKLKKAFSKQFNEYLEKERERLNGKYSPTNLAEVQEIVKNSGLKKLLREDKVAKAGYNKYVGTGNSFAMNQMLYGGDYAKGTCPKTLAKNIKDTTDLISKYHLEKDTKLVRYTGFSPLNQILSQLGNEHLTMDNLMIDSDDVLHQQKVTEQYLALVNSATAGKEFTFDSFTSVSYNADANLFSHKFVEMEIYAQKGIEALYTINDSESEIVLQRGTKFKMVGVTYEDRKVKLIIEAIGTEEHD